MSAIAKPSSTYYCNVSESSSVEGGVFKKKDGKLTGVLIDNAISAVSKAIPPLTKSEMKRALLKAQAMCFAKGLTTVDDAMLENEMVHAIDELASKWRS